jgi:hypothetical protein
MLDKDTKPLVAEAQVRLEQPLAALVVMVVTVALD